MPIHLLLAIALATGSATDTEVCAGIARDTEPQFQIQEVDLDQGSAVEAAEKLREMVALGNIDGEYQYGVLNQIKILKGHVLLQQAISDRRDFGVGSPEANDTKESFCRWLVADGFWYD